MDERKRRASTGSRPDVTHLISIKMAPSYQIRRRRCVQTCAAVHLLRASDAFSGLLCSDACPKYRRRSTGRFEEDAEQRLAAWCCAERRRDWRKRKPGTAEAQNDAEPEPEIARARRRQALGKQRSLRPGQSCLPTAPPAPLPSAPPPARSQTLIPSYIVYFGATHERRNPSMASADHGIRGAS